MLTYPYSYWCSLLFSLLLLSQISPIWQTIQILLLLGFILSWHSSYIIQSDKTSLANKECMTHYNNPSMIQWYIHQSHYIYLGVIVIFFEDIYSHVNIKNYMGKIDSKVITESLNRFLWICCFWYKPYQPSWNSSLQLQTILFKSFLLNPPSPTQFSITFFGVVWIFSVKLHVHSIEQFLFLRH